MGRIRPIVMDHSRDLEYAFGYFKKMEVEAKNKVDGLKLLRYRALRGFLERLFLVWLVFINFNSSLRR